MTPDELIETAREATRGERQEHYGHPRDNHGCTAALWEAYLRRAMNSRGALTITPRDVCNLNILQKVSRDAHLPKADNDVDVVGYSLNKATLAVEELTEED